MIVVAMVAALGYSHAQAQNQTFQDLAKGKSCAYGNDQQQLDCQYIIGQSLHIVIAGIGQPDTSITFNHSNIKGEYFARVGKLHGCVIVVPGKSSGRPLLGNHAFISPENGMIYATWEECKKGL